MDLTKKNETNTLTLFLQSCLNAGLVMCALLAATASAAPPVMVNVALAGNVNSIERQGPRCVYKGEFNLTTQIDGVMVEGRARARWTDACTPELLQLLNEAPGNVMGVADMRLNVGSTASSNPDGFKISGSATSWPVPLIGVASSAGTNPEGFRINGVGSSASGNPEG
jgi:hypothetical protein